MKMLRGESGFTLVELMLVIVILGILIAIAVPQLAGMLGEADRATVESDMRLIADAMDRYYMRAGDRSYAGATLGGGGTADLIANYDIDGEVGADPTSSGSNYSISTNDSDGDGDDDEYAISTNNVLEGVGQGIALYGNQEGERTIQTFGSSPLPAAPGDF